jgi:urea transport system substrate-binding protein
MNRSSGFRPTVMLLSIVLTCITVLAGCGRQDAIPLRVGVVHALTGTMAANEAPLVDAVRMAVDEINAQGGLLGRRVEVVVANSGSDSLRAAKEVSRLITQEKVDVLFACWTSQCRKTVKPVVELNHHLMFYPVQYEGLEQSPNIIYTGSTANQQIIPGAHWALKNLGKRVFLVGSDYVFPRLANHIIRDMVRFNQAEVAGELYRPLGSIDFAAVAEAIRVAQPDVVLNTVNGDSNVAFFRAMQQAGLSRMPIVSFSVDASGLAALSAFDHDPHYAVWGYFQDLPGEANKRFVQAWQARKGVNTPTSAPTSDPIEATYVGVKLWAQAVTASGSADLDVVNLAVARQSVAAPSGILAVDAATRHLWKPVRVGKVRAQGGFEIVFDLGERLKPEPYPAYRARSEWQAVADQAAIPVAVVAESAR